MCAMSGSANSKRIIQIGGPNAPRGSPVYSVPLQGCATINIQLGGVGRTNAAGIGSGNPIRIGPGGNVVQSKGILKSGAAQQTTRNVRGEPRKSAAGTLASGEIVPQTANIVQSSRSKYDSAQIENAQLLRTAADVHSLSDQMDRQSLNSGATYMSASEAKRSSMAIQTENKGNLSDVYASASSMGIQVNPSDLGTLRKAPSESAYGTSNPYGTASDAGAGSTAGGSGIYESGSQTYGSAKDAAGNEGVYSGIDSQDGDAAAYASAASIKSAADQNQIYAESAAVVKSNAKRDSVATGGGNNSEGVYGSSAGEKIYGDDGDGSWMDRPADPNSFRFIGWEVDPENEENLPCKRVLVMKEPDMVLMFTACCQTEEAGNNPKLLNLMTDIADSCVNRLRVLIKDVTSANIAADNMDSLPLADGRHTKEHLEELSRELNETVAITDVAFRFQPADDVYIGTFVQGTVVAKRNYAIGKVGVVAVLQKKSKFATVEAFSEQLCEHIARTKPANLGTMRGNNTKNMTRRGMSKLQEQQRNQLLLQNFIFDPTIVVAEAARRSFVKIDGFLLFK